MSIQKRKGSRGTTYRVEYRGNSETVDSLEAARALDATWKADAAKGVPIVSGKGTVGDWLDEWLDDHVAAPSTLRGYRTVVDLHLKPAFGKVRLRDFTAGTWRKYVKANPRKLSTTTLLQDYRVLHKALEDAKSADPPRLVYNPLEQAKAPKKRNVEREYFTVKQMEKLLKATTGTVYHLPTILGAGLGLRVSEVLAIRWSDIDLDAATVCVRHSLEYYRRKWELKETKGGEVSVLSLSAKTVAALKAHHAAQEQAKRWGDKREYWADLDFVVCNEIGEPLHPKTFSKEFGLLCHGLGMDATFHGLRHSHATMLLAAGVPLKEVSARLRHSTVTLTGDIYGHVLPESEKRINRVVEDKLGL